jgi:hypothetical protein
MAPKLDHEKKHRHEKQHHHHQQHHCHQNSSSSSGNHLCHQKLGLGLGLGLGLVLGLGLMLGLLLEHTRPSKSERDLPRPPILSILQKA